MKKTYNRLDQTEYYYKILQSVCLRSTCNRAMVGAIIVKDKNIISTGYNGAPRGIKHCNNQHLMKDNHCIKTTHAEVNAILQAAKNGININNAEMYCTHKPCFQCMKTLINSGIKKVYYFKDYHDDWQKHFEKNKYCKFIKICVE